MSAMKGSLLALVAALTAGVLAAVALGQDTGPIQITATGTVTPKQAGTPRHPQGVQLDVHGTIAATGDAAPPMPRSVDVWLPKGWRYDGAGLPACALAKLARRGPSACPPGSIRGRGPSGQADVVDDSRPPTMSIINGGATKMYLWIVIQNPARVRTAVAITMTKLDSPRWSTRLHAEIPHSLHVVAGIPMILRSFQLGVRSGTWITTGCPRDHRWHAHLRLTYTSGRVADTGGSVACRR